MVKFEPNRIEGGYGSVVNSSIIFGGTKFFRFKIIFYLFFNYFLPLTSNVNVLNFPLLIKHR